jgi:alkyl hydroperoxide reductase subunit AhpC
MQEVVALQGCLAELERLNTQVLGVSVDSVPCHEAWAKALGGLGFPLLSDIHRRACQVYGVFIPDGNIAERAIFIVDREGMIRFARTYGRKDLPDLREIVAWLERLGREHP